MYNFSRCNHCDKVHNDRQRNYNSLTFCKDCVPLTKEEVQKRCSDYLPVSKGFITYDDTIPIYWAEY